MKNFRNHFITFRDKLRNKEHFAFSRFSDGEMHILQNKELKLDSNLIQIGEKKQGGVYQPADFKHFDPIEHSFSQKKLVESLQYKQTNYYKGISCSCCVGVDLAAS